MDEFNRRVDSEAMKHLYAYYSVENLHDKIVQWYQYAKLASTQQAFMDQHQLWRPEFESWLTQYRKVSSNDVQRDWSIGSYVNGVWGNLPFLRWYNQGKPNDRTDDESYSMERFKAFDSIWSDPTTYRLPRGAIVFEGQSRDRDLVQSRVGHVLHRACPTSSSWQINVALNFAVGEQCIKHDQPTLLVHHIDDDDIQALYVPVELDKRSDEREFELILQPDLCFEVTKECTQTFDVCYLYRCSTQLCRGTFNVKFIRVYRQSK